MKLNKSKCETMYTRLFSNFHFKDGTKVPRKQEAKYLGSVLNEECKVEREVGRRIS